MGRHQDAASVTSISTTTLAAVPVSVNRRTATPGSREASAINSWNRPPGGSRSNQTRRWSRYSVVGRRNASVTTGSRDLSKGNDKGLSSLHQYLMTEAPIGSSSPGETSSRLSSFGSHRSSLLVLPLFAVLLPSTAVHGQPRVPRSRVRSRAARCPEFAPRFPPRHGCG